MMQHVIAGLGNPGDEYQDTRHNAGRIVLEYFRKKNDFLAWEEDKKIKALVSVGNIGKNRITLVEPNNFMNNSGKSLPAFITSVKKAEKLVVVYDDIDLPLGTIKISFNRGSGGHNGLESVRKSVKTKSFIRLRIGVSKTNPSGKIKKPKGEQKTLDFILGKFDKKDKELIKKVSKTASLAIETIITEGREVAMGKFN